MKDKIEVVGTLNRLVDVLTRFLARTLSSFLRAVFISHLNKTPTFIIYLLHFAQYSTFCFGYDTILLV